MAEKRMFTQKIIDSDPFLDMPLSTQALYFHLNMRADDDGFINNPKRIQRTIGASDDDLKLLIAKRFVICFESGVIVIKHWRMHNTLRKDRYNPTQYQEEMALLEVKDNKSYTEKLLEIPMATEWQPNGNQMEPQYSIDKNSIDEGSIGECESKETTPTPAPSKNIYGKFKNVLLTTEEYESIKKECPEYIEKLSSYMASSGKEYPNHYATITNWVLTDKEKQQQPRKNQFNSYSQPKHDFDAMERMFLNETNSEPPKTAADDEGIRERAEALKKQFEGK